MTHATAAGRTAPIQDSLTQPFWQGAARGELLLPLSPDTKEICWPPRRFGPADSSNSPKWIKAGGSGIVYTYSVVHRSTHPRPTVPYVLAVVQLDEGVYFTSNIVEVEPERVFIGMPVTVVFEELPGGGKLPVFRPK